VGQLDASLSLIVQIPQVIALPEIPHTIVSIIMTAQRDFIKIRKYPREGDKADINHQRGGMLLKERIEESQALLITASCIPKGNEFSDHTTSFAPYHRFEV
jgi:hypothetical protein